MQANVNQGLDTGDLADNPVTQFRDWFALTEDAGLVDRTAMTLSSVDARGRPSARIVLLKEIRDEGLVFYTNYESRKGRELIHNPYCALVFWWDRLGQQVRLEGEARKLPAADSDAYFASRPRDSQLGAWASPQSQVVESRAFLEQRMARMEREYQDRAVPRPPHWGGFCVVPHRVEFWLSRGARMHDRFSYERRGERWRIQRLAP